MTQNEENIKQKLQLYPVDYPFETLVYRIEKEKLKLNPEFQRKYKWDEKGWVRASKFIESCLMRIPLPSCYFAENEDGNHEVIDGVQRLTTVEKFFNDAFKLEGMTVFKELEGLKYSELDISIKKELETTSIRCVILRKENPKYLIREIFSRLNQGAVKLSDQEIRHAIYPGKLDDLLIELSENEIIKNFGIGKKSDREHTSREPEEIILRYLAFASDPNLESYKTGLSAFLNDYMEKNANPSDEEINNLKDSFNTALNNCIFALGKEDVFRNTALPSASQQSIILYDLLMGSLGRFKQNELKQYSSKISAAFKEFCESEQFKSLASGGAKNKNHIIKRKEAWQKKLQEAVDA